MGRIWRAANYKANIFTGGTSAERPLTTRCPAVRQPAGFLYDGAMRDRIADLKPEVMSRICHAEKRINLKASNPL